MTGLAAAAQAAFGANGYALAAPTSSAARAGGTATLAQAAAFGNLSGVYLYATLVSAFPLHLVLAGAALLRTGYRDPSFARLALLALAIFGLRALLLTGTAVLLGVFA